MTEQFRHERILEDEIFVWERQHPRELAPNLEGIKLVRTMTWEEFKKQFPASGPEGWSR